MRTYSLDLLVHEAQRCALLLALVLGASGFAPTPAAQTHDQLLATIYPGSIARVDQVALSPSQRKQVLERADTDVPAVLVTRYVMTRQGMVVGRAYLDTHQLRSTTTTVLVALDASGAVRRVEVTAFAEADEPRPPADWLQQFQGMTLTDDLTVNRGIRPMPFAPFTTRAVTNAVRRVLAIDGVLAGVASR